MKLKPEIGSFPRTSIPGAWLGAVLAVSAATWAGLTWVTGEPIVTVVAPVVALVGAGLVILGLLRFEALLIFGLFTRASLDAIDDAVDTQVAGMDLTQVFTLAFAALGVVWLVRTREQGRHASGLAAPLSALVAAAIIGTAFSPDVSVGAPDVARFVTLVVLVLVLERYLTSEERRTRVLLTILGSAIVPIAVGAFQFATRRDLDYRGEFARVHGTLNHPNPFGIYLVFVTILAISLLLNVTWRHRGYLIVFSLASTWMLILTYTRGAWIALVVGVAVVLALGHRRLFPMFAVGVVLVALLGPGVSDRFGDLDTAQTPTGAPGNSLAWRIEVWQDTLSGVENPITGNGLRTSETLIASGKLPHNDFVRVYVELGLIGLAVYGWFLLRLGGIVGRALATARTGLNRGVSLAFAGTFAAFVLLSMTSNVISQLVLLWYLAAIAVLASSIGDSTPMPPERPISGSREVASAEGRAGIA